MPVELTGRVKDTTDTLMNPSRVFLPSRTLLLACVSIAGLVPFTALSVEIEMLPSDGAEIVGSNYQARIAGDGCMTRLEVGGRPFLESGVAGFTKGAYLIAKGNVLRLSGIEPDGDSAVLASGGNASIRYAFSDEGIVFTAKNDRDSTISFFLIIDKSVTDMTTVDGGNYPLPIGNNLNDVTLHSEGSSMTVSGTGKYWPFEGRQAVQFDIRSGESLEVEVGFSSDGSGESAATAPEAAPIAAAPVSTPEPSPARTGGDSALTIASPVEYQIFQRTSETSGPLKIAVTAKDPAHSIEYRLTGESTSGKLPEDWVALEKKAGVAQAEATVETPAGGWYRLEVRTTGGADAEHTAAVERFGIGDIFIGAGQSNSTSCGEVPTETQTGLVSNFTGKDWRLANDPQLGTADQGKKGCKGGSFYPAFGDSLAADLGVPIGVAPTGCTGTSVEYWQPGGDLFKRLVERMDELGEHGFRAVLWHQGETDVEMDGDKYFKLLKKVITTSREKAGWDAPWIVAQATYPDKPKDHPIREAQARIWSEGIAHEGPDTDQLGRKYRDSTAVHFNPEGLDAHGKLWATKVREAQLTF